MRPIRVGGEEGRLERAATALAQRGEEGAHIGRGVGQTTVVEVEQREVRSIHPELAGLAVAVHEAVRRVFDARAPVDEGRGQLGQRLSGGGHDACDVRGPPVKPLELRGHGSPASAHGRQGVERGERLRRGAHAGATVRGVEVRLELATGDRLPHHHPELGDEAFGPGHADAAVVLEQRG